MLESRADVIYADERRISPLHIACTVYPDRNETHTITTTPEQFATMADTLYDNEDSEDNDSDSEEGVQHAVAACITDWVALVVLLVAEGADVR
jgi:hypothetical protein